jgi:DNA polymerase elongation subunit (family B)
MILMADPIIFNISDWHETDEKIDRYNEYTIHIYGRCENGESVSAKITGFEPYFYVEVPSKWDNNLAFKFINKVKTLCQNGVYIKKYELVEKYKFYGFTANKKFKFVKIYFNTLWNMKACSNIIIRNPIAVEGLLILYKIYESNIDPYLRFIHSKDINSTGWIEIKNYELNTKDNSSCHHNIIVSYQNVSSYTYDNIAPFIIASFDIECISEDGQFPEPNKEGDKIIQIGTTFFKNNKVLKRHIITLNSCDPIEGAIVESYYTEREVLLAWGKLLIREDPDFIIGFNIVGFDEVYMFQRWLNIYYNFDPIIYGYLNCTNEKDINNYYKINEKYLISKSIPKLNYWKMIKYKSTCCQEFAKFSKYYDSPLEFTINRISSSSLGDNIYKYFNMIGRVQIDLMKVVQRDYKLDKYKLDFIAEYFMKENIDSIEFINNNYILTVKKPSEDINIGNYIKILEDDDAFDNKFEILEIDGNKITVKGTISGNHEDIINIDNTKKYAFSVVKDDIDHTDIFKNQKGTSYDRHIIAKYCIQDCELVGKLFIKLDMLVNNTSMASVCSVPTTYILLRGQGIKILSLIAKECMRKDYVIPLIKKIYKEDNDDDEKTDESYEGALVIDGELGYFEIPVTVLDYNSLYPSSMIAENISLETLVIDPQYDNLPNYTYNIIEYKQGSKMITNKFAVGDTKGIIPQILEYLLNTRKHYKKLMASEKDPVRKKLYEGYQLGYKLTANSLYGQLGAPTSPVYFKECAASTTAVGRNQLLLASSYVENNFFNELPDEELNELKEKYIIDPQYKIIKYDIVSDLVVRIYTYIPKCMKLGITVLIDNQRAKVIKINKDNYECEFKIEYDIKSDYWTFSKIIYGDSVASYTPIIIKNNNKIQVEQIDNITNNIWISDGDKEFCQVNDIQVWSDLGWTKLNRIIRHKLDINKKMVRVTTNKGLVDVTDNHSLLTKDGVEISPKDLKIGDELLHYNLPSIPHKSLVLTCKTQVEAQQLILASSLDITFTFKDNLYYTKLCDNHSDKIVNIEEIEYSGYVYDLTTDNHHFAAGIGKIIVHNTDSIFIRMNLIDKETELFAKGKEVLGVSIRLGELVSRMLKKRLRPPHNMEYEKTFMPFLLMAKKKYVGYKYETDVNKYIFACMGIVLKRRDNPQLVKIAVKNLLTILLDTGNINKAKEYIKEFLNDMLKGKYSLRYFTTSKTLKDQYKISYDILDDDGNLKRDINRRKLVEKVSISMKYILDKITSDCRDATYDKAIEQLNKVSIAHIKLAAKMAARDPGNKPELNDRIPFVYVETYGDKKVLQSEKIETPDYVIKHNLKLDYVHYITNQLMNPLIQILEFLVDNPKVIFADITNRYKKYRQNYIELKMYKRAIKYKLLKHNLPIYGL